MADRSRPSSLLRAPASDSFAHQWSGAPLRRATSSTAPALPPPGAADPRVSVTTPVRTAVVDPRRPATAPRAPANTSTLWSSPSSSAAAAAQRAYTATGPHRFQAWPATPSRPATPTPPAPRSARAVILRDASPDDGSDHGDLQRALILSPRPGQAETYSDLPVELDHDERSMEGVLVDLLLPDDDAIWADSQAHFLDAGSPTSPLPVHHARKRPREEEEEEEKEDAEATPFTPGAWFDDEPVGGEEAGEVGDDEEDEPLLTPPKARTRAAMVDLSQTSMRRAQSSSAAAPTRPARPAPARPVSTDDARRALASPRAVQSQSPRPPVTAHHPPPRLPVVTQHQSSRPPAAASHQQSLARLGLSSASTLERPFSQNRHTAAAPAAPLAPTQPSPRDQRFATPPPPPPPKSPPRRVREVIVIESCSQETVDEELAAPASALAVVTVEKEVVVLATAEFVEEVHDEDAVRKRDAGGEDAGGDADEVMEESAVDETMEEAEPSGEVQDETVAAAAALAVAAARVAAEAEEEEELVASFDQADDEVDATPADELDEVDELASPALVDAEMPDADHQLVGDNHAHLGGLDAEMALPLPVLEIDDDDDDDDDVVMDERAPELSESASAYVPSSPPTRHSSPPAPEEGPAAPPGPVVLDNNEEEDMRPPSPPSPEFGPAPPPPRQRKQQPADEPTRLSSSPEVLGAVPSRAHDRTSLAPAPPAREPLSFAHQPPSVLDYDQPATPPPPPPPAFDHDQPALPPPPAVPAVDDTVWMYQLALLTSAPAPIVAEIYSACNFYRDRTAAVLDGTATRDQLLAWVWTREDDADLQTRRNVADLEQLAEEKGGVDQLRRRLAVLRMQRERGWMLVIPRDGSVEMDAAGYERRDGLWERIEDARRVVRARRRGESDGDGRQRLRRRIVNGGVVASMNEASAGSAHVPPPPPPVASASANGARAMPASVPPPPPPAAAAKNGHRAWPSFVPPLPPPSVSAAATATNGVGARLSLAHPPPPLPPAAAGVRRRVPASFAAVAAASTMPRPAKRAKTLEWVE
ncbi:hypothetical protein AMAG_14656 [Allomyces macrogynus ATCC 38327]|uniref:Uncharacterized protein n=1 Tax=Allomyces macrogynus (strain ATCC 38327) TaxID=578462 RepID=A0A0L0T6W8_ALLM3|nr:hypothetical protein AMAG_14656 [Allomyces macrogynus ATCC 38327]|eukprot:KNE70533.1 hypothetical protein AMAG_14656 [Allomyces macrogynus ATCC 38327]